MNQNPEQNWFGEQNVTPKEKTEKVISVFDSVANKYDIMNDLMSAGIHRRWKDQLIRRIRPKAGAHYLDVAGGTGDIAFRLRSKIGTNCQITLCDLNTEMLNTGRDRAIDKGWTTDFSWVTGNAENLPLNNKSVDIYTIAFGLRNVTLIDTALQEAYRVLKPGGKFFCLEFSHVEDPVLANFYDFYSYRIIPKIGHFVAKDRESYQYLVESIRKFPKQKQLLKRIENAGFANVQYENLTFGTVAIHTGTKA